MADIGFHRHTSKSTNDRYDLIILLVMAAGPLMFGLLQATLMSLVITLIQFAILGLAVLCLVKGAAAKARYQERRAARAPRIPGLILGSLLVGLFVAVVAMGEMTDIKMPVMLGGLAAILSLFAFGIDPLRSKGLDDPQLMAERAARHLLVSTDDRLRDLSDRVSAFNEPDLSVKIEALHGAILRVLRAFGQSGQDITKIQQPLEKILTLIGAEVDALESGWSADSHSTAKRFTKRMQALGDAFENHVRKLRMKSDEGAIDFDADLLIDRMKGHGI